MRAAIITGPRTIRLDEVSVPTPGPWEVLVRTAACGLCTTDLDILEGRFWASYPIVPGHEVSGVVETVGDEVSSLRLGDVVAIDPNIPCGRCGECRSGFPHLCGSLCAVGVTQGGGFAELVVVPEANTYVLPSGVNPELGALMEPLACVLHGLSRAEITPHDVVAIYGLGFIGLTFALVLAHAGVHRSILIDTSEARRRVARGLGFDVVLDAGDAQPLFVDADRQPSVSIDCTGVPEAIGAAVDATRAGGRVLLFGVANPEVCVAMSPYTVFRKELTILGSFINPFTNQAAVDLLPRLDLDRLVTHRFELGEFEQAVRARRTDPSALKILIRPSSKTTKRDSEEGSR